MHIEHLFRRFTAAVSDDELQPLHISLSEMIYLCLFLR